MRCVKFITAFQVLAVSKALMTSKYRHNLMSQKYQYQKYCTSQSIVGIKGIEDIGICNLRDQKYENIFCKPIITRNF